MRPLWPGPKQPLRGYWQVPPDVLSDPQSLCAWALRAIDAVRRYGNRRRTPLRRRRGTNASA
jgi:TfoX/Sxy family transcriptional regulator of competence genes